MRRRSAVLRLALTPVLAVAACSGDGTTAAKSKPLIISAIQTGQLQAIVGHVVDPAPTVRVTDAAGTPMGGVNVLFYTGGFVVPPAVTGADGLASTTWQLSQRAGVQTLTARIYDPVTMPRPMDVTFTAIALPDTLARINPSSVVAQIGLRSHPAPTAPVVVAVDQYANAKPGVQVNFEVRGEGFVTPVSAVTDSNGRASVVSWTLGDNLGVDTLIARVGNLEPVVFTAQVGSALEAKAIVTESEATCALSPTGAVFCWGFNLNGQVSPQGAASFTLPQHVALPGKALSISGGPAHTCAIVDATVPQAYCWGLNANGQLGTTAPGGSGPMHVPVADGLAVVTTGAQHSCGLTPSGIAYCWGDGTVGQLGTGAITPCYVNAMPPISCPGPKPVAGNLRFVAIAAGSYHTCALAANGQMYCWGRNDSGQLGASSGSPCIQEDYYYGTYAVSCALMPQPVADTTAFSAVAAGAYQTCAVRVPGVVACFGPGGAKVTLGNSIPFASLTPDASCGMRTDGAVFCWGQSFDAPGATYNHPIPLAGGSVFSALTSVYGHRCAIRTDGTAVCWGANEAGELGNGTRSNTVDPSPVLNPPNPQ